MDIVNKTENNNELTVEKMEKLFNSIEEAVDSKDKSKINNYVNNLAYNIRKLLMNAGEEKIRYIIAKYLNRLFSTLPTVRVSACENFDECLKFAIENIDIEKKYLLELRNYLNSSKKTQDYTQLSTAFNVLMVIFIMHSVRNEKINLDVNIWNFGTKGIGYIPTSNTNFLQSKETIDKAKEAVVYGIEVLNKSKQKTL